MPVWIKKESSSCSCPALKTWSTSIMTLLRCLPHRNPYVCSIPSFYEPTEAWSLPETTCTRYFILTTYLKDDRSSSLTCMVDYFTLIDLILKFTVASTEQYSNCAVVNLSKLLPLSTSARSTTTLPTNLIWSGLDFDIKLIIRSDSFFRYFLLIRSYRMFTLICRDSLNRIYDLLAVYRLAEDTITLPLLAFHYKK